MSEIDIPIFEGWELKTLKTKIDDIEKRNPGKNPEEEFKYVEIGSVNDDKNIENFKTLLGKNAPSRARNVIRENDIIYGTTRPYYRNVVLISKEFDNEICSTGFCVLRSDSIEPKFLFYYMLSDLANNQILKPMRGGNYPAVSNNDVTSIKIPIPKKIETQRKIIQKLDYVLEELKEKKKQIFSSIEQNKERIEFFEKNWFSYLINNEIVDEIKRNRNNDSNQNKMDLESIFEKQKNVKTRRNVPKITSPSNYVQSWELPKGWVKKSIGELLHYGAIIDLKDGNHGEIHPKKSEFSKTGMAFITSSQVNHFTIDYMGADKLEGPPLERLKVGFAKKDDVILTHKGSVGRVGIVSQDCILSPQTTYYRLNSTLINNEFLMWFFVSRFFINQRTPIQKQTTRDYLPITKQYTLFLLLPPLLIQKKIVKNIKNAEEKLKEQKIQFKIIKENYESRIKYINHIQSSILNYAFSGKLVS